MAIETNATVGTVTLDGGAQGLSAKAFAEAIAQRLRAASAARENLTAFATLVELYKTAYAHDLDDVLAPVLADVGLLFRPGMVVRHPTWAVGVVESVLRDGRVKVRFRKAPPSQALWPFALSTATEVRS